MMARCTRRIRWAAPLMLLTLVILQLFFQAVAAAERSLTNSSTELDAELERVQEELEEQLEQPEETDVTETVSIRPRKRLWQGYSKRKVAVVLPLLLVAVAAVYVAAGYVLKHHARSVRTRHPPQRPATPTPDVEPAPKAELEAEEAAQASADVSSRGVASLLRVGRAVVPPAVALTLAGGILAYIMKQTPSIPEGTPGGLYPNETISSIGG